MAVAVVSGDAGLLLDRDGTLTVERGYLADPADLEPVPGAQEAVRRAAASGFRIAVVTNQSAVGRGIVDEAGLERMHARLRELFPEVEAVYHCPHLPDDRCRCRKPAPGMIEDAIADLGLDPSRSVLIGDHLTDCLAARAVGLAAVLVETGHGGHHRAEADAAGFLVVADLGTAIDLVTATERTRP